MADKGDVVDGEERSYTELVMTRATGTAAAIRPPEDEQHMVLHGVSWKQYTHINDLFDGRPSIRMTYLEGTLEIMTTSPRHELVKKMIARLLEMWAVETGAALNGYGQTTFRREARSRGLEPDECYVVARTIEDQFADAPDIALEVVITTGFIDKLAVYAGLGVGEVWFWKDGVFELYRLRDGERYERVERSERLPDLDFDLLVRFVERSDQTAAVREYRDALRAE